MSSPIWISRVTPWDFAVEGVMRYTLWFEKPVYREAMFECPVFGPLPYLDFSYGEWGGNNTGIPLKCLRKRNPEFIERVFRDTLQQCYIPVPEDHQDNPYTYLLDVYDKAHDKLLDRRRKVGDPDDIEAFARKSAHEHKLKQQAEQAIEIKGKGWRQHLLEYDLSLQF